LELLEDPYTEIFLALEKHANILNHLVIDLGYNYDDHNNYNIFGYRHDYSFLQYTLLKLHNLKTLTVLSPTFSDNNGFEERLKTVAYCDLETLEMDEMNIHLATCIIKNSRYLRKFIIDKFCVNYDKSNANDESLNLIRTIYENCYLVELLSIPIFPLSENHLIEFEKLLKKCQNLRSLYFISMYLDENEGKELEYGEYLSNVLIRSAPINLREIGIPDEITFSLKILETFFEKWRGRPAISIHFISFLNYE